NGYYATNPPIPPPTGLVDHNHFVNCRVLARGDQSATYPIWQEPSKVGNPDQTGVVYVEDNTFDFNIFGNVIDNDEGGRWVFRHNNVNNAYVEAHSLQNGGGAANREARSWEIYNNTFTATTTEVFCALRLRGGTGVAFNNTFTGSFDFAIGLDNVRS